MKLSGEGGDSGKNCNSINNKKYYTLALIEKRSPLNIAPRLSDINNTAQGSLAHGGPQQASGSRSLQV